jgi:hypothetical protein
VVKEVTVNWRRRDPFEESERQIRVRRQQTGKEDQEGEIRVQRTRGGERRQRLWTG